MTTAQLSTDQMRSLWQKHQKNLNVLVVILLVIYLLAYAAELVWRLIPAPEQAATQVTQTQVNTGSDNKTQVNINAIKQLKLFGDPEVVEVVTEEVVPDVAPETNLNLTLTGLVASTTETDGAAIIENKGAQNTYGIGDKVDNTNAIVKEVKRDRIIIDNGGRFETLMLDGHDFDEANKKIASQGKNRPSMGPSAPTKPKRKNVNRQLNRKNAEMARSLRTSPAKFTDFISIQPFRQSGKIAGYKVNPGRDPALFQAAGLRPNDVLTEINGLDLTDVQQSMQAMNMLRTADFLQITVSRNGEITTLDLELPESNEQ